MKTTLVSVFTALLVTVLPAVDTSKPFDLTTKTGEKFKNCRITKVTPDGISLMHDGGVAKVGFEMLDDAWKNLFHYDPAKAREFAEAEAVRQKDAEVKRAAMSRERERLEEQQLAAIAAAERRRLEAEAKSVEALKAANAPITPSASLPGDATPALSQPVMQTEAVVPTVTPVGDPYTPTKIRSSTHVWPDSYSGHGYAPYSYGYGYYQPVYSYPGYVTPRPPCVQATPYPGTGVSGTIRSGGFSIRVGR